MIMTVTVIEAIAVKLVVRVQAIVTFIILATPSPILVRTLKVMARRYMNQHINDNDQSQLQATDICSGHVLLRCFSTWPMDQGVKRRPLTRYSKKQGPNVLTTTIRMATTAVQHPDRYLISAHKRNNQDHDHDDRHNTRNINDQIFLPRQEGAMDASGWGNAPSVSMPRTSPACTAPQTKQARRRGQDQADSTQPSFNENTWCVPSGTCTTHTHTPPESAHQHLLFKPT